MAKKAPAAKGLKSVVANFSVRTLSAVTVTSPVPMGTALVYNFGGILVTTVSLTIDTSPIPTSVNIDIVTDPPAAPHPQSPDPNGTKSVPGVTAGFNQPTIFAAPIVVPQGTGNFAPLLVRIWIPVGPGRFSLNVIPITTQLM
jgi:hypothetical protein